MELSELENRITRLEDLEAIKQLKARYCEICDDDHNPERITSIFTEDGIWEGRGIGDARGHEEIKGLFQNFQRMISYSQHMVLNPIIEIDGTSATGIWYFFGPFTFYEDNQAMWQAARYREDYEKVDGVWKIKHLRIKGPRMSAKYEAGWAK
ncbi:MAG: nuclear transport factor 2 family protein [Gammaproteobacteria bacterium]|nr:nuclear transport factor 2 family protein [Gammaproteobacteria bacterium]